MDTACKKICKPRCLPFLPELASYIKKNRAQIDGIISSEVFSLCSLTAAGKAPEKTIIWHELAVHNRMMHYIPSKVWYSLVAKLAFRKVQVVARSENARQFISKYCKNVSKTIIDHGVNVEKIKPQKEKQKHFAVLSQLIGRKRIDRTIEAFADFVKQKEETGEYVLDIIGQGELEAELREQTERLQIKDRVIFHGQLPHEQLAPIIAAAKALLVYTMKDNNMVSIVESIAAGTPVITTSVPFNAAYIRREQLGIVDDNWNKETLNQICEQNAAYVENCMAYREKLSASYGAGRFKELIRKDCCGIEE